MQVAESTVAVELVLAHLRRQGVGSAGRQPVAKDLKVSECRPERVGAYGIPDESAWFVTMPWYDGEDGRLLRVSRLVVIAKSDGRVLFDGSAGDEG